LKQFVFEGKSSLSSFFDRALQDSFSNFSCNAGIFAFEKEFLQIEAEQRRKKEEEEKQVEERRSAARKLQSQHEELQQQRQAEVRRKMENKNGSPDPR